MFSEAGQDSVLGLVLEFTLVPHAHTHGYLLLRSRHALRSPSWWSSLPVHSVRFSSRIFKKKPVFLRFCPKVSEEIRSQTSSIRQRRERAASCARPPVKGHTRVHGDHREADIRACALSRPERQNISLHWSKSKHYSKVTSNLHFLIIQYFK